MPDKKRKIPDQDYREHVFYDSDDDHMELLGNQPSTNFLPPQAIHAQDFSLQNPSQTPSSQDLSLQSPHIQTSIAPTLQLRAITNYQGRPLESAFKKDFCIEYENSQGEIKKVANRDALDFIVDYYTKEPSDPQCVFKKIRNISGNFFKVLIYKRKLSETFFKYQHTLHPNFFGSKDANSVPKAAFYLAIMACIESVNNSNFSLTDALNNSNFGYINTFSKDKLRSMGDGDSFFQINCLIYFSLLQKLARIENSQTNPNLYGIPSSINIIKLDIAPDVLKTELLVGAFLCIDTESPAYKHLNLYFSNTKTRPVLLKNLINQISTNQEVNFTAITNFVQQKRDLPPIPTTVAATSAEGSSAQTVQAAATSTDDSSADRSSDQTVHDQTSVARPSSAFQIFSKNSCRGLQTQISKNL